MHSKINIRLNRNQIKDYFSKESFTNLRYLFICLSFSLSLFFLYPFHTSMNYKFGLGLERGPPSLVRTME